MFTGRRFSVAGRVIAGLLLIHTIVYAVRRLHPLRNGLPANVAGFSAAALPHLSMCSTRAIRLSVIAGRLCSERCRHWCLDHRPSRLAVRPRDTRCRDRWAFGRADRTRFGGRGRRPRAGWGSSVQRTVGIIWSVSALRGIRGKHGRSRRGTRGIDHLGVPKCARAQNRKLDFGRSRFLVRCVGAIRSSHCVGVEVGRHMLLSRGVYPGDVLETATVPIG